MAKLFANNGDPDQMRHSATSDLGLHCLPVSILGVSRLKLGYVLRAVPCDMMTLTSIMCSNLTFSRRQIDDIFRRI